MNLYYIHDNSDPEFNCDLFVWAATPDMACLYWREYYWPGHAEDENVKLDMHQFPETMFTVPTAEPQTEAALLWHVDVNEVPIPTKIACAAFGVNMKGALS